MKAGGGDAPRVLLLAGDVRGNMGDRAIRAALCAEIRKVAPDAELYILSSTPGRDEAEFGARSLGSSPFVLVAQAWRLRQFDSVVWGGGQLLQDDSSLVKNIYWAVLLTWVRRALGLRIAGLGLGLGPIDTSFGRFFARIALRQLDLFIGRDERSAELARALGGRRIPVRVAPDLAWWLPAASPASAREYLARVEKLELDPAEIVVGVTVRRWFHLNRSILPYAWRSPSRGSESRMFETFLDNLGDALRVYAAGRPVRLLFFPMASSNWEGDASFSRRVGERSGLRYHVLRLASDAPTAQALAGRCTMFVSVRMHSALLALTMGVPTAVLYHVPKVRDLLESIGLGPQALALDSAAASDGAGRIADLLRGTDDRADAIRAALRERTRTVREQETVYLDAISLMMGSGRGAEDSAGPRYAR